TTGHPTCQTDNQQRQGKLFMTATVTSLPLAEPKRDRYGRYLLPHPDTGKEQPWTRVTTIASTTADRFGLEAWAQRNTVLGIGLRPDLYALAVSSTVDDRQQLTRVVKQAQEAAKASSGANLGTALHRITERSDRGEEVDVPAEWKGDVYAYHQTLADHHVTIHSDWIERIVVLPELGIAGTLDRLVTLAGQAAMTVADLKTGKDVVKYGTTEIAIQLALYANATHVWNGDGYDPMPPTNTDKGLIIHLPVGKAECNLHTVDIAAGWETVQLALAVREWRKRKDLTAPYSILDQAENMLKPVNTPKPVNDDDW
ncbi:hypothetical protein LCGC14_2585990, partial [marine sediment metagenome]